MEPLVLSRSSGTHKSLYHESFRLRPYPMVLRASSPEPSVHHLKLLTVGKDDHYGHYTIPVFLSLPPYLTRENYS